jgi:hypothetical protein
MLNIISQYANASTIEAKLAKDKNLAKLAYEFCSEFKLVLSEHTHANKLTIENYYGIPMGNIGVGIDGGDTFFTYTSESVTKERGSGRSNSSTRDSKNISSLIKVIKKKKEEPSLNGVLQFLSSPLRYALGSVNKRELPRIHMDTEHAIALIESAILDKALNPDYIEIFREQHAAYMKTLEKFEDGEKTAARFNKGFTLVSLHGEVNATTHYLVGDAIADSDGKITLQGELKRYNSLYDSPLAPTVAIIGAHFSGKSNEGRNDFKIPRTDHYYEDIDVASGYMGDGFVVVIPKEAP